MGQRLAFLSCKDLENNSSEKDRYETLILLLSVYVNYINTNLCV